MGYIHVDDFQVARDGTETLTTLQNAINAAKSAGAPLHLGHGGVIKASPTTTIDLGNIPAVLGESVTLDLSGASASPTLLKQGSRTQLLGGNPVSLTPGRTLSIGQAISTQTLPLGSVLGIVSNESLPNTARSSYRKGQRVTVFANDGAGTIKVTPTLRDTYTEAYLYRIDEASFHIGPSVRLVGPGSSANVIGLSLRYCAADIACKMELWGGDAIEFVTSSGNFEGQIKANPSTYSEGRGVVVRDLSLVRVSAFIESSRHAVGGGGGSVWTTGDVGVASGTDGIAFPSSYTITGGHYSSHQEARALDAHGVVDEMIISGCTVDGGIQTGARRTIVSDVFITQDMTQTDCRALLITDNNSLDWGALMIRNVHLEGIGLHSGANANPLVEILSPSKRIDIDGLTVEGSWHSGTGNRVPVVIDAEVGACSLRNVSARRLLDQAGSQPGNAIVIRAYNTCTYYLGSIDIGSDRLQLEVHESGCRARVSQVVGSSADNYSVYCLGTGHAEGFEFIEIHQPDIRDAQNNSIYILRAQRVRVVDGAARSAGRANSGVPAARSSIRLEEVVTAMVHDCDISTDDSSSLLQSYSIYHTAPSSGSGTLSVQGCDMRNTANVDPIFLGSSVTLLQDVGNLEN